MAVSNLTQDHLQPCHIIVASLIMALSLFKSDKTKLETFIWLRKRTFDIFLILKWERESLIKTVKILIVKKDIIKIKINILSICYLFYLSIA